MRYCNFCHRVTTGQALFCNFCGRSYDLKLCPHRHPNPRDAESCSQCGSRDLSIPQPRVPWWLSVMLVLFSALPGLLLLALTLLFLAGLVNAFLTNPAIEAQALVGGLMLALLWYLYMHLPGFIRRFLTRLIRRHHKNDHAN